MLMIINIINNKSPVVVNVSPSFHTPLQAACLSVLTPVDAVGWGFFIAEVTPHLATAAWKIAFAHRL